MKAIKKPIEIDFYEIKTLSSYDIGEMSKWIRIMGENPEEVLDIKLNVNSNTYTVKVNTLEGTSYDLTTEDMLMRGIKGEYYPCKKEIFYETYNIILN
ncbi:MAG TPA: hypothetical protein PLV83_00625 [Bacilli bacterium]|nr:hypothetical protein [Bacilli bacterium]